MKLENEDVGEIVVAFAFGAPATLFPNAMVAAFAKKLSEEVNSFGSASIFTQRDIPLDGPGVNFIENNSEGQPPTTLQIVRRVIWRAKIMGVKEVWIVAAPLHLRRCRRDFEKEARETELEIHTVDEKDDFFSAAFVNSCFDARSTQWWTRSWWRWWMREIPLRLLPWWLYKRVTG